jgi:hypothetical protein
MQLVLLAVETVDIFNPLYYEVLICLLAVFSAFAAVADHFTVTVAPSLN